MSVSVEFDWGVACDADLVGAAAAGNPAAFAGIYDRYAGRLYDFCLGMVGDRDAADCVHEAFCVAVTDLASLREPDKLRPWLYAIARNQALRTLRNRRREMTSDDLPDAPSSEAGPETVVRRNELAALIATAKDGLSDRDREVLDLVYRHGLTGPELAQALGVGNEAAKKMAQRVRSGIERSLGALLIAHQARSGRNRCPELGAVMADWDGEFTVLVRKRISRHIESCAKCDEHRGKLVSPVALLGSAPLLIPVPGWLREPTLVSMQHASLGATAAGAGAAAHTAGRFAAWMTALLAVPAVTVGVVVSLTTTPPVAPSTAVQVGSSVSSTTVVSDPKIIAPEPNTPAPPAAPATTDAPIPGYRGAPPATQQPAPPPTTAVADEPVTTATTHAQPAPHAPSTTKAPQAPEPTKPPVHQRPTRTTTTTQAPPPPCPRIAVDNGPVCGRPTP